ncbi:MAG: DNA-3-methyladenine glycosylase [Burkholderiales bacterium]|nr:DNA-3-methyladenine glycosylase [Burkholderiales bacterium]
MTAVPRWQRLPREFYQRDTIAVARDLLGTLLVREHEGVLMAGRIVEVEAYLGPSDLAAHSSKGLTTRTATMFGPAGHAYVYMIYGMHFCMNVVTQGHTGTAVLLRALEPLSNVDGRTQGPALLCQALRIDRRLDGEDLLGERLYLAAPPTPYRFRIARRPRIGVGYAGVWARRLLRFYVSGNRFVSRR